MLDRRNLLTVLGAAIFVASPALAAEDHSAHMHAAAAGAAPANAKLIETASDCVKTGQACIAHCLQSFAAGDTSLAACAKSVDQMLSVCATLQARIPRFAEPAGDGQGGAGGVRRLRKGVPQARRSSRHLQGLRRRL